VLIVEEVEELFVVVVVVVEVFNSEGIISINLITKLSKPIYVGGSFNISFSNKIVTFCLDNSIRKLFYELNSYYFTFRLTFISVVIFN
jgi:hypothetical protein